MKPSKHIEKYWNYDEVIDYLNKKYKINQSEFLENVFDRFNISPDYPIFEMDVLSWKNELDTPYWIKEILTNIYKEFKEDNMNFRIDF